MMETRPLSSNVELMALKPDRDGVFISPDGDIWSICVKAGTIDVLEAYLHISEEWYPMDELPDGTWCQVVLNHIVDHGD